MRKIPLFAVPLFLTCWMQASSHEPATVQERDESTEPPLQLVVTVGDKSVAITEGASSELPGQFTDPQVSVKVSQFRLFQCQGVSFRYPRTFNFEADLKSPESKGWTLTGNDVTLMLFVINTPTTTREFVEELVGQFGEANCQIKDTNPQIVLGEHTLTGTTLHANVASHHLVMNVYLVSTQDDATRMLVIQDSPKQSGEPSDDAQELIKVLAESFSLADRTSDARRNE